MTTDSKHHPSGESSDRPVTIKEVAARAAVSPGTVSNVLNRPDRVATATRARVHAAISETGFVRNASASRLRALDNRAIGILVVDIGNYFQASVAKGAQRAAEAQGFMTLLCDGDRAIDRTIRQIEFLESHRVAGVLATASSIRGIADRLDALRRRGVAIVLVDRPSSEPDQCSVAVDDVHGGAMIGDHLLSLGRRRIIAVTTDFAFGPFDDRIAGLQSAIADHPTVGAQVRVVRLPMEQYEDGRRTVDVAGALEADAVFCVNDYIAFATMRELLARGVDVPGDIAVIGYDDTQLASMAPVALSSVRQPAYTVGETAAQLLIEECASGEHVHQHLMFQPELIARASTIGGAFSSR